ncbi:hypothetical protein JCM19052_3276 [Vibrio sp. JCM 19052]|nr:hypothetical protein JCM19052_3276 [Vibrio sp. JCM 19052]
MKWMSVLSIITLSSALSGCGGSDSSDPEIAVRALNFQTVNFVSQNPSGVSDISVQANYGSLQEDIYSNQPLYGATETGLLLIQENASTFDITFDLIETNSQQTLVSETRSIAVSNPQVIFAFGDANTGFYDLSSKTNPTRAVQPILKSLYSLWMLANSKAVSTVMFGWMAPNGSLI